MKQIQQIVIVTGQSGSGKSSALRTLEDIGYTCIDNLPSALVIPLLDSFSQSPNERKGEKRRLALGLDARQDHELETLPALIDDIKKKIPKTDVLFIEAAEDILLRRFSETRRVHPLHRGQGLRDAIHRETTLLTEIAEIADIRINTSALSPHTLKERVADLFGAADNQNRLHIVLQSFGFKYGVPSEADLIFDLRFLPNPYFIAELKDKSGHDASVRDYVLSTPIAQQMLTRLESFLTFLLPQYRKEGRRYINIGLGCTGGKHRSVTFARTLFERLDSPNEKLKAFIKRDELTLSTYHRDTPERN